MLCRPGDDLLSQVLRHSTIGAKAFDGRVRDGIGSDRSAKATRPAKHKKRSKLAFKRSGCFAAIILRDGPSGLLRDEGVGNALSRRIISSEKYGTFRDDALDGH